VTPADIIRPSFPTYHLVQCLFHRADAYHLTATRPIVWGHIAGGDDAAREAHLGGFAHPEERLSGGPDLAREAPKLTLGSDLEFLSRPEWKAVDVAYHFAFKAKRSFQPTFMYRALDSGQADIISAFSSDGRIVVVQNGEIFNFQELAVELLALRDFYYGYDLKLANEA